MSIVISNYRNKLLGCWMGKNIGGTLGAPFEWRRQINDVDFYTQDLKGEPLPNDDLDIQLLWLYAMEEKGVDIDSKLMAEYWNTYVTPNWAEYGTAKANMRIGLMPPLSGTVNNAYKHSCGSFIRSEIWACMAPGIPEKAAELALQDSIIDHGDGEGTYAEVFCAALESAAFVETDIRRLIDIGLSYIPADSYISRAVKKSIESYENGLTWKQARDEMLENFRGACSNAMISDEDRKNGFQNGEYGFDAPSNIGILIIGMLYGEGDFDKSICTTVNCGEDTDCTAATYGSIFGIMHGIEAIPEKWKTPIGRSIKNITLNIGDLGAFHPFIPTDIDNLTQRVERIAKRYIEKNELEILFLQEHKTEQKASLNLIASSSFKEIYQYTRGPVYKFDFFDVFVDYESNPFINEGIIKKIKIIITNKDKFMQNINIKWYIPEAWEIRPSKNLNAYVSTMHMGAASKEIQFEILPNKINETVFKMVVELGINGRHTTMLVPIILIRG